jgi:hypothetical protein
VDWDGKSQKENPSTWLRRKQCVGQIAKIGIMRRRMLKLTVVGQPWWKKSNLFRCMVRTLSTSSIDYGSQIMRSPGLVSLDIPDMWTLDPKDADFPAAKTCCKCL